MVLIVDREGLSERVVEGKLVLGKESDRLVVYVLMRVVRFVLSHESVIGAREIRVLWIGPVGFPMALGPTMVETRGPADSSVVEGENLLASEVQVVVRAPEVATRIDLARESVHAAMISARLLACAWMIRSARHVRQSPEVIVE